MSETFDSIEVSPEVKRFTELSFMIVDRIDEILERKGMLFKDFAKEIRKEVPYPYEMMRGNHNFTIGEIAKIESILGEKLI